MRLLIVNRKTLYLILLALILILTIFIVVQRRDKVEDVFNTDIIYQGNKDEKIIAFACNVDWGNEYIRGMLDVFKEKDIKITFFITGRWAEKHNDLVKLIYDEGHEIGNHGFQHIDYDKLDFNRNYEEIKKAHDIIKSITNSSPKYFAPPSGAYNDNTIKAAKELDYKLILWSIDTIDWRDDSTKDKIIQRVTEKVHNSGIVLMHPTENTNKALPEIIDYLFEKGYKVGRISDIL